MRFLLALVLVSLFAPIVHATDTDRLDLITEVDSDWVPSPYTALVLDVANAGTFQGTRINCADSTSAFIKPTSATSAQSFTTDLHQYVTPPRQIVSVQVQTCIRRAATTSGSVTLQAYVVNEHTSQVWSGDPFTVTAGSASSPRPSISDVIIQLGGVTVVASDTWVVGIKVVGGTSSDATKLAVHGIQATGQWFPWPATTPAAGNPYWSGTGFTVGNFPVVSTAPANQEIIWYEWTFAIDGGAWSANPVVDHSAPWVYQGGWACGQTVEGRVRARNARGASPWAYHPSSLFKSCF